METLASKVGAGETDLNIPTQTPPSKLKTYGFIIAIIVGIGGLGVGGTGLAGYFHAGALSNLAQIDALIMMAMGGGGVILLIVGIVGTVKNHQSLQKTGSISSVDTQGGLFYGPEVWPELGKKWGCELKILDMKIPDASEKDVAEGRVRIYIPQRVSVNGEEKNFTLNNLIEMGGGPFEYCNSLVKDQFGNNTASGWIEYDTKKDMVEKKGCRKPTVLEAVVLKLMLFAFADEPLYWNDPSTYICCSEKVDDKYPVVVGGFGCDGCFESEGFGFSFLRRF